MPTNTLEILIRARDEATRTINQASQSVTAAQRSTEQGAVAFTRASGQMERSAVSFSQKVSGASASARFLGFTVINELSPALGTGASRIASLASVATLGGTAMTSLAVVAGGGLVIALSGYFQAAKKAREEQEKLNEAVSRGNVAFLASRLNELRQQESEAEERLAGFREQFARLPGNVDVAAGVSESERRLGKVREQILDVTRAMNREVQRKIEGDQREAGVTREKTLEEMAFEERVRTATEAASELAAAVARITAEKQRDTDATMALLQAESLEAREAEMLVGIRDAQARATQRAREELEELERAATERAEESAIVTVRRASEARLQPIRDIFAAVDRAVSGTVSGILQGTLTAEEAVRRMASNMAASLVEQIVQRGLRQVREALIDTFLMSQSGGGGGSLLGTIFNAIGAIFVGGGGGAPGGGSTIGPPQFAQHGAHLASFQPAIVGEAGPELFIPRVAGDVIPNDKLGGTTTNIYIDARGAQRGVSAEIQRAIRDMGLAAVQMSVNRVNDERRRGGMKGFGR